MLFFFKVSNNRNLRIESERKSSDFEHKVKMNAMRSYIIPLVSAVVLFSSCSVYRQGQTPDDVYYSPARTQGGAAAYVDADNGRNDGRRYNDRNRNSYSGYDDYATADDRWLMMRVRNRARWSLFDDYNYYSPYGSWGWGGFYPGIGMGMGMGPGMGWGMGFNGFYNPFGFSYYNHFNNYWNWNSFYNPYYSNIVVVNPKANPAGYNRIRNFNLTRYNNTNYSNRSGLSARPTGDFRSRYNNTNNNSRLGSSSRGVYNNSSIDSRPRNTYRNNSSYDRPTRTYTPSQNNSPSYSPRSGGSSGSSSGSSGGGGSRPSRR